MSNAMMKAMIVMLSSTIVVMAEDMMMTYLPSDGPSLIPSDTPSLVPSMTPSNLMAPVSLPVPPPEEPNPACEDDADEFAVDTGVYCNNNCSPDEFIPLACGPPAIDDLNFCLCIVRDLVPIFDECPVIDGTPIAQLSTNDLVDVVGQEVIDFCCGFAAQQCIDFGLLPPEEEEEEADELRVDGRL